MSRPTSLLLLFVLACDGAPPAPAPAPPAAEAPAPRPAALPLKGVIDVITVKNGDAEVPGRLDGLSGGLTLVEGSWARADGSFTVALSSWDSGLELRDTRVEETFFEVAKAPEARFDLARFEGAPAEPLGVGAEPVAMTAQGRLTFHGVAQDLSLPVKVQRVAEAAYVVESAAPVTLDVFAFGMQDQLEALRVLCAHDALSNTVTLSLRLALGEARVPGTEPPEGPPEGAAEADVPAKP